MSTRTVSTALLAPALASGALLLSAGAAFAAPESFTASLSGANEVGGGSGSVSGTGTVTIDPATGEVCARVTTTVTDAVAMHIHKGGSTANGPIAVPLDIKSINGDRICVKATAEVATAIVADPAGYYLNVHTPAEPAGVERGQLAAATPGGTSAGSGGQAETNPGPNVALVVLAVAGAGLAGAAGWRLVRR